MVNLSSALKSVLTDNVIGKISSLIGSNSSATGSIISGLMPKLMNGIISKGSTESGASSLLNLIKDNNFGSGDIMNNLSGGAGTDSFLKSGAAASESIFGNALGGLTNNISGLSGGAGSKLMSILTPLALGSIGKVVSSNNLDANGLKDFLQSQKTLTASAGSAATHAKETVTRAAETKSSGGGGLLKWILPLLLALAALYFFMTKDKSADTTTASNTEVVETTTNERATKTTATHTHADGTVHEGHSHGESTTTSTSGSTETAGEGTATDATGAAGLSVDAVGNLIMDGKIVAKAGEFKMVDGEYVDMDGNKLSFLKKVGKAIGGAATKTADAFKDVFGGMFKKKSEGSAVAAYTLSKIVFDKESNRITDFSKNEVEGLAAALKGNADSKISVEVYTNDGDSDKANKKLSKTRAEVVRDMLVTLGVNKKQISFDGKGAGDVAKAGMDKVEIVVK